MPVSGSDPIVAFFSGGRDTEGRTLDQILDWDDGRLEGMHDYIQWLFPTRQPSGVNPYAPLVTDATAGAFARTDILRANLRRAFERMLVFYGLRWNDGSVEIDEGRFAVRGRVWLHAGNHNHLRLTRIMDSLAALGLRTEARALQRCLIDEVAANASPGQITPRTVQFWRSAGDG
jgi:Opioid growth factor receptor (OGFr) conserved region